MTPLAVWFSFRRGVCPWCPGNCVHQARARWAVFSYVEREILCGDCDEILDLREPHTCAPCAPP